MMEPERDPELEALVSLLETERPESVAVLQEQIRTFPEARVRQLMFMARGKPAAEQHVQLILAELQAPRTQAALLAWAGGPADLEEGMRLVCRTRDPLFAYFEHQMGSGLDFYAGGVPEHMNGEDAVKRLKALSQFLHVRHGFRGDTADYHNPDNSYLDRVLTRKVGLPLTLTALYMLIGRRIGLNIVGIPLPGHFIAGLVTGRHTIYFDPFRNGIVLETTDVMSIVNSAGFVFHPDTLRPATSQQIVQRTFKNLESAYALRDEAERLSLVRQYLSVLGGST